VVEKESGVASVRHGVTLNVYIDAATLAGLNDHPGELAGFGAITARRSTTTVTPARTTWICCAGRITG
jgi:hypothetical protein